MIITITLNPCLDKHIEVYGLAINETNRWTSLRQDAGGKGIDVARSIHIMDGHTMAYGFIGGQEGRTIEILLDDEGVPFSFTPIRQETRMCFIINDTKTHQQTKINPPGPHITKVEMDRFRKHLWSIYSKPDLIVASGSVPPGVPDNIYYTLTLGAKDRGVRTILDSTGRWLKEGIKARPYLIKPNVSEAEELLQTELPTEEAITQAAINLVDMGPQIAIISRGEKGIIAADREKVIKAVPPVVKVQSTVGAGDSTVAGLALKLAQGESLKEACRLAVAMGTAAALTPGTELCRKADVYELLPQIKVQETKVRHWRKVFATTANKGKPAGGNK